jgi:uncharacterized protein (TIGR03067 family)
MFLKQRTFVICLAIILLAGFSGCTKETPSQVSDLDRMQGTWTGTELAAGREGQWTLVITGDQIKVDGPGPEDYSGAIALDESTTPKSAQFTINECAVESYIGATGHNIYKFENDKLFLAGAEPGSDTKPTSFEGGDNIRHFEFEKGETE